MPPPFVPKISHELDVGNFATEFTNMAPQDSPAAVPMNVEKMFKVIQNVFSILLQHDYMITDISIEGTRILCGFCYISVIL